MTKPLDDFGILSLKNQQIGSATLRGISGGQKRRVTLARSLVNPALKVVFADEITSGLSASDAVACMYALEQRIRSDSVTVVMVIHQPR